LGKCNLILKKGEGVIRSEIKVDKESIVIISVYGEQGGKNLTERLDAMTELEGEENVIMGGNFNLRIENLGKQGVEERETDKHSKDICIDSV